MRERARGALIVVPAGAVLLAWPIGTYLVTLTLIVLAAREAALLFGAFSGAASERRIALLLLSALFGGVISGGSALAALTIVALIIVAGEIYVLLDADEEHILERAHGLIAGVVASRQASLRRRVSRASLAALRLPLLQARSPRCCFSIPRRSGEPSGAGSPPSLPKGEICWSRRSSAQPARRAAQR